MLASSSSGATTGSGRPTGSFATSVADQLPTDVDFDLVLVTVLAHQVAPLLPRLVESRGRTVMFMFNTFEPLGRLRDAVGAARFAFGFPAILAGLEGARPLARLAAPVPDDPAVVAAYKADPLVHDRISARLAKFIAEAGPATLALTAVAQTAPERELDALHALQHARYVEGRDNADPAVIAEVLRALGLPEAAALALAPDTALRRATAERTATAQATLRAVGARGVPQLVVTGQGGALRLLGGDALLGPREQLVALVRAAAAA